MIFVCKIGGIGYICSVKSNSGNQVDYPMEEMHSALQPLKIKPTSITPRVDFDPESGTLVLQGVSMPENVVSFYTPVLDWSYRYIKTPAPQTRIDLQLSYFNTASSKMFLEILAIFEELHEAGNDVRVVWYYADNDVDLFEAGEDFKLLLRLPFSVVENTKKEK